MYAFIEGQVCDKSGGTLVLLAGGVGYQITCPMSTIQAAPAVGAVMRCYTSLSVREDAVELFGFATREEKEFFLRLTSVSGVGPRMALGLLSAMTIRDLNMAILMDDVTALTRAPGIGRKTAQRITLELKDKITQAELTAQPAAASQAGQTPVAADAVGEALEALMALGYSSTEARQAISQVRGQADDAGKLVSLALRAMANL